MWPGNLICCVAPIAGGLSTTVSVAIRVNPQKCLITDALIACYTGLDIGSTIRCRRRPTLRTVYTFDERLVFEAKITCIWSNVGLKSLAQFS
jgi:hypothetical protein